MICKRCGSEIDEKNAFCPQCGKPTSEKKKSNLGKIIGCLLPAVLIGFGIALYSFRGYKNILPKSQDPIEDVQTVATIMTTDESTPVTKPETVENVEEVEEISDELEQYLDSLSLEPVELTMGETFHVELEQEISDAVWKSSNEDVAKVTEGLIKAVAPGNTKVTLSTSGRDLSFNVTVNAFADMTLAVDCSATIELNDTVSNVRWESSEPETVSINDGVISSLGAGSAIITAYIEEVPYSFEVVATTPDITTTSVRKIIGNTEQVSILGTKGKVEWKSDNTAIATVSDTGLITAEGTGAGQSTIVHAYVDGMEFKIDVEVEPIPQLSSTYKIYGHQDDSTYKNANITICTNANEIVSFEAARNPLREGEMHLNGPEKVLNVADADYSDGTTYPVYHIFKGRSKDNANYTDVYLVGTSQEATVLVQAWSYPTGLFIESSSTVTYEAGEGYGIIHIYERGGGFTDGLVTVSVDGYQYQFMIMTMKYGTYAPSGYSSGGYFSYGKIDELPVDYMVEECSVDEVVVASNRNYSAVSANSKTYNPGNEWVERIGTKFVESLEKQAIDMAAGALLKFIFL